MKLRLSIVATLCAAFLTGVPSALADDARIYYVSLGDSLALGGQPKTEDCCARGPTTGAAFADVRAPARIPEARVPAADLRVRVIGLPRETRVGGNVGYAVKLVNAGRRQATGVMLWIKVDTNAAVVSVASAGISCSSADERNRLRCITATLPGHRRARVDVAARATSLGTLRVTATVSSTTREVTWSNNRAEVETSVLAPDSVHADAYRSGRFPIQLWLDAISAPDGEDPAGTFTLSWQGKSSGRVTCVNVAGNKATVGVVIDNADGTPGTAGLLFLLTDNGSPGAGHDTLTFGGGGPALSDCPAWPFAEGSAITSGEITIIDTP